METTILLLLVCAAVESAMIRRFYLINDELNWNAAQDYCTKDYTDLAFIDNVMDQEDLSRVSDDLPKKAWIGLHRNPQNMSTWKWSGGRSMNYTNWAWGQPDNWNGTQDKVITNPKGEWNDRQGDKHSPFYCYSLRVVEEEAKTWEEALKHCRRRGSDLMSLRRHTSFSRSDLREQLGRIQSQQVWIGLRFLSDRWMWVSGHTWMWPSWTSEDEHQCPLQKRCGAVTKAGLWENRDCQEKLPFICD